MLLDAGYARLRTKGSHRIYVKGTRRVVVPFHQGKVLHPKIGQQIFRSLQER